MVDTLRSSPQAAWSAVHTGPSDFPGLFWTSPAGLSTLQEGASSTRPFITDGVFQHCATSMRWILLLGVQVVVLSQVLACNATLGYEDLYNMRVQKFNGTSLQSLQHLAQLSTACAEKYMRFDLDHSVSALSL